MDSDWRGIGQVLALIRLLKVVWLKVGRVAQGRIAQGGGPLLLFLFFAMGSCKVAQRDESFPTSPLPRCGLEILSVAHGCALWPLSKVVKLTPWRAKATTLDPTSLHPLCPSTRATLSPKPWRRVGLVALVCDFGWGAWGG